MGTETMIMISVVANIIVFLASMIDLASGMYKAWYRKEKWKSDVLKRTGFKFVLYQGSLLNANAFPETATLYVPAGSKATYEAATNYGSFTIVERTA